MSRPKRPTRWYVSARGWWWSRGEWCRESQPPLSSHAEHRTLRVARRSARSLMRAGADDVEMLCVYPNGESRAFGYSVGRA